MEGVGCGTQHGARCAALHKYDGRKIFSLDNEQFGELTLLCGHIVTSDAACASLTAAASAAMDGERVDHVFALILGESALTPHARAHAR